MEKSTETSRINIDDVMSKMQRHLGANWDQYRETLTTFLMGKLSRPEMVEQLSKLLKPRDTRMHNYLLLAILANGFREMPPGEDQALSGWKQPQRKVTADTPSELLHKEILSLPARERKRIKNIVREKREPAPPPCLIATRQAMLPRIPYVQDKKAKQPAQRPQHIESVDGLHPPRLSGPLMWTQDIIHGLDAPLAQDSYELPDNTSVGSRMLGIALENGLLRGIDAGTTDVMLASLDAYLNTLVEGLAAFVRAKDPNVGKRGARGRPLNATDLNSFFDARTVEFHEVLPPVYRLKAEFLKDEEDAIPPEPGIKRPLDLLAAPERKKRTKVQQEALDNAEKGREMIRGLLSS